MQLTRTEVTGLNQAMTPKQIAVHLTTTKGETVTETNVKNILKQLGLTPKKLRGSNPITVVDGPIEVTDSIIFYSP